MRRNKKHETSAKQQMMTKKKKKRTANVPLQPNDPKNVCLAKCRSFLLRAWLLNNEIECVSVLCQDDNMSENVERREHILCSYNDF